MKKFITICLITLIAITSAFAINKGDIRIGANAGGGFYDITSSTNTGYATMSSTLEITGLQLEAFAEAGLTNNMYIKGTFGSILLAESKASILSFTLKGPEVSPQINTTVTIGYNQSFSNIFEIFFGGGFSLLSGSFGTTNTMTNETVFKSGTTIGVCVETGMRNSITKNVALGITLNYSMLFKHTGELFKDQSDTSSFSSKSIRAVAGLVINL